MGEQTQIGILGIGAIGTVIAAHLLGRNSNDLAYFSRTKKSHLKLITETATIEHPITIQTSVPSTPMALDWLIICLKEHQFKNATEWFSKLIGEHTRVAVIRNGLYLKTPLLDFVEDKRILECLIDCPTQGNSSGFFYYHNIPKLTIPKGDLAVRFTRLFKDSNMRLTQVIDFKTEGWKKLCESATLGAILCLHNDTCKIFKNEAILTHYKNLLIESVAVAKADGASIETNFIDEMLLKLKSYPETKGSSMLFDLRQGRPLEMGAKNGIISKLGKQYHINTPYNDAILKQLA